MSKKQSSVLSDEMKQNIQNYGGEIKTLEDFVTVVRQNPGYQLGSIGNKGVKNMAREIWQNSFDEMDKASSPCTWTKIIFDERTCGFTCIDNGRGIPLGDILRIFTDPNTSSNYTKKPGEYSSGLHGVGAKVTNAMSHRFIVESYKYTGDARRVEFIEGYPWDKGEVKIPNPEKKQGSMIYFEPSVDALGEINISWKDVYRWLTNITPLNAVGDIVYFTAIDSKGKEYNETITNEDGIFTYLIKETETPLIKPIYLHRDTGQMKFDIALTWDASEAANNHIIAFSNKCPTVFGTHIDGFEDGLTSFFVNYMNKIYLVSQSQKKSKLTVVKNDIKSGLKAIISAAHLVPIFDGQSKERLSNAEMEPFVKTSVMELLDDWAKNNTKDLATLCKYFKDIAEVRNSADKERVKLSNKYNRSKLTGLPAKFVAPRIKWDELFISEGDSAGTAMRNWRLNDIQGYFPIRGKLPNAFRTNRKDFLSNAEIAGIIQIIGGGYGRDFDLSKVKWKKIIFATDADKDGNHIKVLLLRFFLLYMPQLIEAGRIYAAVPPLYGVQIGKKTIYLRDRMEYIRYIQKDFSKNNVIYDPITKTPMSNKELFKLLYMNIDYNIELNRVASNHAVDPVLLESILTLYFNKVSFSKFESSIKKQFKFIDTIEKKNGMIVITGLVGSKYQTVFLNDMLISESKIVFDQIAQNKHMVYKCNDKVVSIYELMDLFDKSKPNSIQRFKGLGEMGGSKLFDSTLDPTKRTLIQYTIEDVKEEVETIKYYENDLSRLIQDVKVSRFDVME